jgi:hypothetical protein
MAEREGKKEDRSPVVMVDGCRRELKRRKERQKQKRGRSELARKESTATI